jgi:hypothetical protein
MSSVIIGEFSQKIYLVLQEESEESQSTSKEVAKHDNFIGFGGRGLLIKRSATVASRKKPSCLIFPLGLQ